MDVTDASTIEIPAGLKVLVNNAGVDGDYLPVEHAPIEEWRRVFETNVFGLLEVTRRAIPVLRSNGGGVICNMTSSSLYVPVPFYGVYRASKAAVAAMGESLAAEVANFGIRVLDIPPGPIATDMLEASDRLPEGGRYEGYEQLAEQMLEGRRSISSMVAPVESAAAAIGEAIVGDDRRLRQGCDPLGQGLLDAWRSNPEQFLQG
jgi:NAD(P)-dependent dehydrogenase (short-subunit alcohol dehydrogenase family)